MKRLINLLLIAALVVGLLATVPAQPVLADCIETSSNVWECATNDADGVSTGGGGDTVTVNAGVTVSNSGDAIESSGNLSVFNSGTVNGDGGDGVDVGNNLIDLTNTGTIAATYEGVDVGNDLTGDLNNSGQIISDDSDGVYIDNDVRAVATITNTGEIEGDEHGIYIGEDMAGTIFNSGSIEGDDEDGIHIGDDLRNAGIIINTGTIFGEEYGIYIDGTLRGVIVNSGVIEGDDEDGIYADSANGGVIINFGSILGSDNGIDIDGGNSVFIVNTSLNSITGGDRGIRSDADYTEVFNTGGITGNDGDGIEIEQEGLVFNSGLIFGDEDGIDFDGGSLNFVINDGTIIASDQSGIDGDSGQEVIYHNGTLIGGSDGAMNLRGGDDWVILGAGGVSYGTACGDIATTLVDYNPAVVQGVMDGGSEIEGDTIVFSILTPNQAEVEALDAYLASLDGNADGVVNGQYYDWEDFEFYGINSTIYTEGATRLHDDGVLLAFAAPGGIDICSGEKGFRAGTIDFKALAAGQTTFSAGNEGWFVTVTNNGGVYSVRMFDGAGVEHFNDADKNGRNDSPFSFTP